MNKREYKPQEKPTPDLEIKLVGGAKNHLGTRVSRRVTCSRCGCNDYISFVPGSPEKILCKACAKLIHLAYEVGESPKPESANYNCDQCETPFELGQKTLERLLEKKPGEIYCQNCSLGLAGWQGKAKGGPKGPSEKRLSGALLRRKASKS